MENAQPFPVQKLTTEEEQRIITLNRVMIAFAVLTFNNAALNLFLFFRDDFLWNHLAATLIVSAFFAVLFASWRLKQRGNIDTAVYLIVGAIAIVQFIPFTFIWENNTFGLVASNFAIPVFVAYLLIPQRRYVILTVIISIIATTFVVILDQIVPFPWTRLDVSQHPILRFNNPFSSSISVAIVVWFLYRIYRDSRTLRVRLLFDFVSMALVAVLIIGGLSIYLSVQNTQQLIANGGLPPGDFSFVYTVASITAVASIVSILIAVAVAFLESRTIATPMDDLAGTAVRIEQGELDLVAEIPQFEEVAVVARAFNSMTAQLRDFIGNLEQRVAERTQALETSAEVSRRLSQILDQKQLVTEVVDQVRTSFNYYHAHIYLFDPTEENLLMVGGTGRAGQEMLANNHKVARGQGLVGRAAETNDIVLVPDVQLEEGWLPNPLLPDTKAETAVPIATRNRVLGVLDVQHNVRNGLTQADADLLSSIANQVAVALQNAELLSETEDQAESLAQLNRMSEELTRATSETEIFTVAAAQIEKVIETHYVLLASLTAGDVMHLRALSEYTNFLLPSQEWGLDDTAIGSVIRNNRSASYTNIQASDWEDLQALGEQGLRSTLIAPLVVAGEVISSLCISHYDVNAYTRRDEDVMRQMASLLSSALENAQLTQQTRQALESTATLYNAGRRLNEAGNLQEAVAVIPTDIPVPAINRAILGIFERSPLGEIEAILVTANWYRGDGTLPPSVGTRYSRNVLNELEFLFSQQPTYFRDLKTTNMGPAGVTLVETWQVRAAAVLPLYVGTRQVGSLILLGDDPHNFAEQERQPYVALATQLASTVETRRLFEEAQARAEQERRVRTITDKIRRGTDRESIIRIAQQEISELLGASHSSVRLGTQSQLLSRLQHQVVASSGEADDTYNNDNNGSNSM